VSLPERCFYVPGDLTLIDFEIRGKGAYSGETLAETDKRYPGVQSMTYHDACTAIDAATAKRYKVGQAEEIDDSAFFYALGVLPPVRWYRGEGVETFEMSELESGNITACFVRIGSRYFRIYSKVRTAPEFLIRSARECITNSGPQVAGFIPGTAPGSARDCKPGASVTEWAKP